MTLFNFSESFIRELFSFMEHNRYERIEEVFSGANSVAVYRCADKSTGQTVMIKCFPKQNFSQAFFQNELQINKTVACRNIIKVLDTYETRTSYNLVMEAGSMDLCDYVLSEGPLGQEKFLKLFLGVAVAISNLHDKNIIHNDLKLENIVFKGDNLYLIDFGLSEHVRGNNQGNNRLIGSTFYTAPEVIRDNFRSFKSDIYSFGIVMFVALTGSYPFDAENIYEYTIAQLNSQPSLNTLRSLDVKDNIVNLIGSCLSVNPDQRPTIHEIIETLWPSRSFLSANTSSENSTSETLESD